MVWACARFSASSANSARRSGSATVSKAPSQAAGDSLSSTRIPPPYGGGILVLDNESPAAWLGALETVAEPDLRAEFAELALKRAQAQTIDKHVDLWHNVYSGAW